MFKKMFLIAASWLLFHLVEAQEDYRKIFSSDYEAAIQFLANEEKWMDVIIQSHGLRPKEVKAIVFPELMRYNSFQDKMETFALESLYIQQGKTYANFSIGRFQIKPSFAENIEIDLIKKFGESEMKNFLNTPTTDTVQSLEARSARMKRIKEKETQLEYVCLFFRLMEQRYPIWETEEEKIKFFASAYNSDYQKSSNEVKQFISKKFFHTGFAAMKKYSYADIAWYYFGETR
ncbi:MAG TPA: hypothetical protein VL728_06980 [Cyclobacteriaceae bacterium]|nr:hypothetical protein [Cyclobacteriaceae bacterium]